MPHSGHTRVAAGRQYRSLAGHHRPPQGDRRLAGGRPPTPTDGGAARAPRRDHDGDADTNEALWKTWRNLPDKQRQAVALHHVAGLPYAEVAELLGGSAAAARRAAADGVATLRRRYPPTRKPQRTGSTR